MSWANDHHSKKVIKLQICVGRVNDDLNEGIAHCRELDLISLGSIAKDALKTMLETIDVQLDVCNQEINKDQRVPELYCSCEESWSIWHLTAAKLNSPEIDDLITEWTVRHTELNIKISVFENHTEVIGRDIDIDECYNIFKVLLYINCQLINSHRLRLLPVDSNKNYYSLCGQGFSNHIQTYPLPMFQLYNLNMYHIGRIIKRFCLQSLDMSELYRIHV